MKLVNYGGYMVGLHPSKSPGWKLLKKDRKNKHSLSLQFIPLGEPLKTRCRVCQKSVFLSGRISSRTLLRSYESLTIHISIEGLFSKSIILHLVSCMEIIKAITRIPRNNTSNAAHRIYSSPTNASNS